jgi:hypothetical protein
MDFDRADVKPKGRIYTYSNLIERAASEASVPPILQITSTK